MALSGHRNGTPGGAENDPRLARIYREAGDDGPPAHLDAAILAAAHREVGANPRPFSALLRWWQVPVSIAAVVVVSASLVILMREEGTERLTDPKLGAPAASRREEAPPASAEYPITAPQEPVAPAALPEPGVRAPRAPPVSREAVTDKPPPTPARERAEPARQSAPATAESAPPFAAVPAPRPADPASRAERESAAEPAAVPKEARTRSEARAPLGERPAADLAKPAAAAAPESGRPAEVDPGTGRVLGERLPVWHAYERERPEKWLERIEELRRQGQGAAAEEMLAEFKRRFPGHPLPAASR
ncbi:MAG: hypothetical protein FJY54_06925 [Betaproteobacteria bacterium]|nr:hypothetical protein [Betaproteobacteria bacterium]